MDIRLLIGKLIQSSRRDGALATARKAILHLRHAPAMDEFDLKNGTDTSGLEPLWALNIHSPNAQYGERYEATGEGELATALEHLDEDLRAFTFVDLGCGKGRTLLIAATLGFRRVIGVEFARELVEIAGGNIARKGVANAQVLLLDAAAFKFPEGNTVVYLYNPFSEQVVRRVVANLGESKVAKLYVIYKGAQCAAALDSCAFLQRFSKPPTAPHMQVWRGTREVGRDGAANATSPGLA